MAIKHVVRWASTETDTIVEHWLERRQDGSIVWCSKAVNGDSIEQLIRFKNGAFYVCDDSARMPGAVPSMGNQNHIAVFL